MSPHNLQHPYIIFKMTDMQLFWLDCTVQCFSVTLRRILPFSNASAASSLCIGQQSPFTIFVVQHACVLEWMSHCSYSTVYLPYFVLLLRWKMCNIFFLFPMNLFLFSFFFLFFSRKTQTYSMAFLQVCFSMQWYTGADYTLNSEHTLKMPL